MLPENQKNENKFDEILKKALKKHREPIRQDFTQELLAKIRTVEQQKALAKVIRQERAALAAFILLPVGAIAVMFAFPNLAAESAQLLTKLYSLIIQSIESFINQWQLWVSYTLAAAACLYAFYESLLREN